MVNVTGRGVQIIPTGGNPRNPQVCPEDIQRAIDQAGKSYREGSGQTPTHVRLPEWADTSELQLFTLSLGQPTGQARMVVVGRVE